jgi:hypothetical protein
MPRDLVLGDKWLFLAVLGVVGVFALGAFGSGRFEQVIYAIDRGLYGLF